EGRGGVYFGTSALNISRTEVRAIKKVDRLIAEDSSSQSMRARDRVSESVFDVPQEVLIPVVRRISHYPRFAVTNETDYLVSRYFQGLDGIMRSIYGEKKGDQFVARVRERWSDRVQEGMSHLTFARRIDVAAAGTYHIAVYTQNLSFTGASAWCFRGLSEEDSRLVCLWLNSSLFLYQVLERRAQTRGSWWYFNKHGFARTNLPDTTSLSGTQRRELLGVFDSLHDMDFPPLLEQPRASFHGRMKIAGAWLNVLGVPTDQHQDLLVALHRYLYETLSTLRGSMHQD